MARYNKFKARYNDAGERDPKGQWSIWIHPAAKQFKMSCCDCGLVHDLEFRLDDENQLNFRARRNERATSAIRREGAKRRD